MRMRLWRSARIQFVETLIICFWLSAFPSYWSFAGDLVPYKGSAIGMITEQVPIGTGDPLAPFGEPFLLVRAEAVGNFTHVGKSAVILTYTARLTLIESEVYMLASGIYTVTGADGSVLTGPFSSKQRFGAEDFRAEVAVAGGTGRFRNATGALIAIGKTFADGSFFYDLDGTITSIGKAKR